MIGLRKEDLDYIDEKDKDHIVYLHYKKIEISDAIYVVNVDANIYKMKH